MPTVAARPRLRVGIVKMASCDGCQLTLLDLEDELLALADRFEIVEFPEASSLRSAGPYDVLLVEGSVEHARPGRGDPWSCAARPSSSSRSAPARATAASRRSATGPTTTRSGPRSTPTPSTSSRWPRPRPSSEHVKVDLELHGCPISPEQLREVLVSVAVGPAAADPRGGRLPRVQAQGRRVRDGRAGRAVPRPGDPERLRGAVPDVRARLLRLLRPARAGRTRRASPARSPLGGREGEDVSRLFSGFTGWSPPFRTVIDAYGGPPGRTPEPVAAAPPGRRKEAADARRYRRHAHRGRARHRGARVQGPVHHPRRGRGLAEPARPRRRGGGRAPEDLRGTALLRAARRRAGPGTRSSTSSPGSAASARSRTR